MEYKKSMIIIILAIFLLSIAGVCASDANDTVVASEDATAIELSQSEEITTTDESQKTIQTNGTEILTASDETTAAQNNPDTLSLEEKTYADLSNALGSGGDIDLQPAYFKYNGESRSITITNPGIINGNGAIIDMAGSNIQAFQVYVSGVTFKNMTIQNANFYDAGGAIFFNVGITGTVLNCNFVNNTVSGRGGAIYFNVESTGEVANCNFTDNKAAIGGGAVYFYDNGDVTNCNFINNTAEFCGAISLNNGTVTNCNFTNNNATGKNIEGGALGMNYGSVENCNFISNTASKGEGGAITMISGNVTNCNFNSNKAIRSGAIRFSGNGNVTNCNFTGNEEGYGGAIRFHRNGNVTNCNFVNNTATDGNSGAISMLSSGTVENCNFTGNKATCDGSCGGAVMIGSKGNVTNCNFIKNTAAGDGGAIDFEDEGTVTNCNFTGNNATRGSAIYFHSSSSVKTVSNSIFLNNRANATDLQIEKTDNKIKIVFIGENDLLNAIYSNGDVGFTNVTYWGANGITNTNTYTPSRSNNEAGQKITVEIYDSNDNLVENVTFVTDDNGQATYDFIKLSNGDYKYKAYHSEDCYYIYAESNGTFTLDSTLGDFNRLQKYINGAGENSVITLCRNYTFTIGSDENLVDGIVIDKRLTINGNGYIIDAQGKARIFNVTAGSINITDVTLKNGKADKGGAIYFSNDISNSNINATYINNTANGQDYDDGGGANYFKGSVSGSNITGTYIGNNATRDGGANLFRSSVSDSNIIGTYNNNNAKAWGGANNFHTVSVSNVSGTYANNKAKFGGGANYWGSVSDSNVTGTYSNNTASSGGANFFDSRVSGSNVSGIYSNNTASSGGANYFYLSVSGSNVTGTYTNNKATNGDGGANCFVSGVLDSNVSGTYANNNATEGGGANCFNVVSGSNVSGTYANNNAAELGGANYFYTVSDSNISGTYVNNNAGGGSGVNYFDEEVLNSIIDGLYINNTASNSSIIFFKSKYGNLINVTICNSIFLNNKYNGSMGVIFAEKTGVVAKDNWFGNNATNYETQPKTTGIQMDSCLFLNGTNNQNNIKFFLMSYNGTTSEYDNTLLPKINLTVITTDGIVDKSVVGLDETVKFSPTESGINRITAQIEDAAQTVEVTNGDFDVLQTIISNASENSVINLTRNYTYNQWDKMRDGVLIDKKVTVNGNGFTIDAKGKSRIFNVTAGSINITDVTLKNGKADKGGAIYFSNDISNSNINATYINNTSNGQDYDDGGGANYFKGSVSGSIVAGIFANNTATASGGANFFRGSVSGSNVTGTYINNTARICGGANCFQSSVSGSNVTGIFANNTATVYGGVNCFWDSVSGSIVAGIFANNNATDSGGANYFRGSVSGLNVTGTYINNTAKSGGGANCFSGSVSGSIVAGTYNNNKAGDKGGVNRFVGSVSDSNVGGTYANNTAKYGGGANYFGASVSGSNVTGTYINNTAKSGGGANFFGFRVSGSNVTGIFTSNNATYGGANNFYNNVSGSNVGGTYASNNATYGGANFFWDSVSGSNVTGTYINNTASATIYFWDLFNNGLDVEITNAIFLNNKCEYEIYTHIQSSGVVVKDSWFGNNASNMWNEPNNYNVQIDNWLFLNATADYSSLLVMNSSNITFKLYSTNGSNVSVFDNSKLPVVNLTLTATKGEVSNSTTLDKSVEYRATQAGQGSVTASVEDAEYTIFLDNIGLDSGFSAKVDPQEIDYGKNAAVILEYNVTATGTVNITLTGKKHNQTIENVDLNKTITLPDTILPDEYEVTVSYSGDDVFVNATAASSLTVNQLKSDIKVVGYDIYVNDTTGLIFTVILPENAMGNLTINNTITLNVTKEGRKENNSLIIEIMDDAYSVGQYNWTFTYSGDDIYENSQANAAANILIVPTEITANVTSSLFVDDTGKVSYNLTPGDAVGDVKFTSNDTSVVEVDQDGNIKAIAEGTAIITVTFEGCENYTASSTNVTVTVSKIATEITLTNGTVELKAYKSIGDLAILSPAGAGNLTYASSDEDIVLVSEDGIIYARIKGTATVTVSFAGDNKYKAAESKNITVIVTLNDASVSTENDTIDLYVDDTCIINATANPRFLTVYYTSSNESVATVTEYGNVKAVGEGTAVITLTVGNGETYAINTTNVTVTVSKVPTEIIIQNATLDMKVGDEIIINATLTPAGAGNVTFTSSDYNVVDFDDEGNVIAQGKGQAIITVSFAGDNKYAAAENMTINVTVSLNDASVTVDNDTLDLKVGETYKINATKHPDTILLDIAYTSSNSSVVSVDENGIVTAVGEGTAIITVEVGDDEIYAKNSTTVTFTVSKIPAEIIVQNATVDMKVTDEVTPVVSLMPSGAGELDFTSSDVSVVTVDGIGTITAVGEGVANVTVRFIGNDKYAAAESKNITVTVSLKDANASVSMPENVTVGDNSTVNVKLPSDAAGNVTVKVDGEVVDTVQVTDGSADVTIHSLSAGNHTVEIAYSGDGKYSPASEIKDITVSKRDTTPEIAVEGSNADVKLPSDAGGNVTVKVDGEVIGTVPVTDGTASVKLPKLSAGNHTVEIDYSGDDKYNPSTETVTVSMNMDSTRLTADNVTATYKVKKYLTITLTDSSGSPIANATVSVKLKSSKNYTTDANGQVKVKVSSLLPKTYTAKIAFNGDDKYTGSNTTAKVTVKKAASKITAKAKTFKTTAKIKKYTVTLKANGKALKNKWVYLKVNGVTYKAKTNSKGKATFNLKKLAKTGTAKITYKGNDYYKKATKKVKLTVKSSFKTISKGSKNHEIVKKIQRALKNHGYYLVYNGHYLKVDGIFWDYTEMAVKEFQNDKKLKVTGKVDEKTAKKLGII